jgi:3',5'-cyclic AMP phosphodiesterase CpdA
MVSGDLTKDGERQCHDKVSKALSKLTQNGIKVFVVPGNHDVNNPLAYKYDGDNTISVPSITQDEFASIYKNFGYGSAIYRDKDTLSYVAEPTDNLWIVALDTCRYKENKPGEEEIFSGKMSQEQEEWLCDMLKKANENKKAVIVLEHHGLVEHWIGQSKLHPEYLIPDYKRVGELMASYNVRLAFTGHYHAQDIVMSKFDNGGFLYDIETGSLITAPCSK